MADLFDRTLRSSIGTAVNLFFRAPDLLRRFGREPGTFFICVDEAGLWGNLRIIDPTNALWRIMVDNADPALTVDTVDREAYLMRALGRSCEVEWIDTAIWKRRSVVAERYSQGRVFLAGDAVHQHSPTGALGMNSGIGDAVDLGWKLAALLEGWSGDGRLASYDLERRPIGERNVRQATEFYRHNAALDGMGAEMRLDSAAGRTARERLGQILMRDIVREFDTLGMQIGYRYENSPICVPDGTPSPADDPATYVPTARPGSRAPHVWLDDGRSILDLFGRGFVLLRFPDAPDPSGLEAAAKRCRLPLTVVSVGDRTAAELYDEHFVLIRPDGHVAWRGSELPVQPDTLLARVRGAAVPTDLNAN